MAAPSLQTFQQGQGVVTADNLNTFVQSCDTLAQLRTLTGVPGMQITVRGISAVGDGGQGNFYWNATGTGPDDNLNVVVPSGTSTVTTPVGVWSRLTTSSTVTPRHGSCYLKVISTTSIQLAPYDGAGIQINGVIYTIPSAGVSASNSSTYVNGTVGLSLAPTTTYYVYAVIVGGIIVLDFWTGINSGYQIDTSLTNNGVMVRQSGSGPDSTRTLVGVIYTDSSSWFQDTRSQRLCASWFNRKPRGLSGTPVAPTTTSATLVELSTAARVQFVCFAGTSYTASTEGSMWNSSATAAIATICGSLDGVQIGNEASITTTAANAIGPAACTNYAGDLADGYHYFTALGRANVGGTALYSFYINGLLGS